ncbi:leucine-rich repeat domain-containing protein [Sutcliffiella cohnii]
MKKSFSLLVIFTLLLSLLSPISTFAEGEVDNSSHVDVEANLVIVSEDEEQEVLEESQEVVEETEETIQEETSSEEENEAEQGNLEELQYNALEKLEQQPDFDEDRYLYIEPLYVNENSFSIYWGGYVDGKNITSYELYLDDVLVTTINARNTEYVFNNVQPETTYKVTVKAFSRDQTLLIEETIEVTTWKSPVGNVVTFADKQLELAIKEQLGVTRDLKESDIEQLTYLYAGSFGISDLSGIEKATNLQSLFLYDNNISNLSPLSGLRNLVDLDVDSNKIVDVSPLKDLSNLYFLAIANNPVSDISSLSTLVNLEYLFLHETNVDSIDVIKNFSHLTLLTIEGTNIDYSEGTSTYEFLMELVDAGVYVDVFSDDEYGNFDIWLEAVTENAAYITWWHYEDDEFHYTYRIYLNQQLQEETTDTELVLSNLSADTDYELEVEVLDEQGEVIEVGYLFFQTLPNPSGEIVTIADPGLEEAIKDQLKIQDRVIYESDMGRLDWLEAGYREIESLEGLQLAENLEGLFLDGNLLTDLSPLAELPYLTLLSLGTNQITDITPLNYLPLWYLDLSNNPLADITALSNAIELEFLLLHETTITDISFLLDLESLQIVTLFNIPTLTFEEGTDESYVVSVLLERGVEVILSEDDFFGSSDIFLHVLNTTSTEIEAEWFYEGESDVSYYEVYLDYDLVDTVTEGYYHFTKLLPETLYTVGIAAYNGDGEIIDYNEVDIETLPLSADDEKSEEEPGDGLEEEPGDDKGEIVEEAKPTPAPKKNENGKGEGKKSTNDTGKKLPKTATNTMNFVATGVILLLVGVLFFYLSRRKKLA